MLLTTNSSCATALHHLVADTVEVNGGSRNLMRVLNRLVVSVSADTHDRLVTEVAEKQTTWSELSSYTTVLFVGRKLLQERALLLLHADTVS